jgi:hypothetical protein
MPYYGNPHLDEFLRQTQGNPHGDYSSLLPIILAGGSTVPPFEKGEYLDHRPADKHHYGRKLYTDQNLSNWQRLKELQKLTPEQYREMTEVHRRVLGGNETLADAINRAKKDSGVYQFRQALKKIGGGLLSIGARYGPGVGLMMYPTAAGDSRSDFGFADPEAFKRIQDNAQRKGLEGRRLYPKNPRGMGALPSKKVSFGESVNKPQSKWEQSQERLALRRREEEEERRKKIAEAQARQNQILQKYISRVIKPNIVPQKTWDAWVPSDGMSNYSIFDPAGGFKGLDADALMSDLFGGAAPDDLS